MKKLILIPRLQKSKDIPHYTHAEPGEQDYSLANFQYQLTLPYEKATYWRVVGEEERAWRKKMQDRIDDLLLEWIEPVEFIDTFEVVGYYRGRSAAGIELKSLSTGGKVCFMLGDLLTLVTHVVRGKITGRWQYKKRGQNYFVGFLGEI